MIDLEPIREYVKWPNGLLHDTAAQHLRALLTEIEQLRAKLAATESELTNARELLNLSLNGSEALHAKLAAAERERDEAQGEAAGLRKALGEVRQIAYQWPLEVTMRALCHIADKALATPATAKPHLFNAGNFALHSGAMSNFKIDCDALTDADWASLAAYIAPSLPPFSRVVGIPNGGVAFAAALQSYCQADGLTLIVDDVLTTGQSMEKTRDFTDKNAIGLVLFARGECPGWIHPVFQLSGLKLIGERDAAQGDLKRLAQELAVDHSAALKTLIDERDAALAEVAAMSTAVESLVDWLERKMEWPKDHYGWELVDGVKRTLAAPATATAKRVEAMQRVCEAERLREALQQLPGEYAAALSAGLDNEGAWECVVEYVGAALAALEKEE